MIIKNQLSIGGEAAIIDELYDVVLAEDAFGTLFSMKWIIPLPNSLRSFIYGKGEADLKGYIAYKNSGLTLEEFFEEHEGDIDISLGRELYVLCQKWQISTPKELRHELWGSDSAFNAHVDKEKQIIHFSTNNTAPIKAIEELALLFPELAFDYYYADDEGHYTGHCVYGLHDPIVYRPPSQSSEALRISDYLWRGESNYERRSA